MGFLDLFRPTVDTAPPEEREFIEGAFLWLAEQFTWQPLLRRTVVPTTEFFPRDWTATDDELDDLLARLCSRMDLDHAKVRLDVFTDGADPIQSLVPVGGHGNDGPAGLYFDERSEERFVIAVAVSQLDNAPSLVATLAHELGHVHLLGHQRLRWDDPRHERFTDLLAVFFGFGIFTANSAFQFSQWQEGGWQGWSARRLGYLDEPSLGYALACYAWVRSEHRPPWASYLAHGVKVHFEAALKLIGQSDSKLPRLSP